MINLSIRLTCDALAILCERRLGDTVWRGDSQIQMCTMSTRKPVVAQQLGESSGVPIRNCIYQQIDNRDFTTFPEIIFRCS